MSTPLSIYHPVGSVASVGARFRAASPAARVPRPAVPSATARASKNADSAGAAAARARPGRGSSLPPLARGPEPSTSGRSHRQNTVRAAATEDAPAQTSSGIPDGNLRKDASASEYAELKQTLLKTTALYGAGLTAYCTLGYGLANGLSAALGTTGGVAYLLMLQRYVDDLEPKEGWEDELYTRNLVYEPVTDVFGMIGGAFGKVGQVYSQALLQKRLLVPCAVAVFASAFNALDFPFDFNYGPVLLGFVTYKAAVLSIMYEDVKGDITRAIAGSANGEGAEER